MEVVVFTNGCFDILHPGHVDLLRRAREMGSKLIVGINSDESIKKIKGATRPFLNENDRKDILMGLSSVDEVVIFDETTPQAVIEKIKPNVLVKGGDWDEREIIGADFVIKNGGKVFSLPLKKGYSSSSIIDKILNQSGKINKKFEETQHCVIKSLKEHQEVFQKIIQNQIQAIKNCGELISQTVVKGNKILICGNGGSASDAQHIATELVGRYENERRGLAAIALTTDTSALTAIGNDYGFERVFARQVEALARAGDCLIAISTSGNSPNVIAAVMAARSIGCQTIGLTGAGGKKLASLCDAAVLVPAIRTSRIQEAHITIGHLWCEIIDKEYNS
jgi:D-sedoheptulose 7-phosphate isomerase